MNLLAALVLLGCQPPPDAPAATASVSTTAYGTQGPLSGRDTAMGPTGDTGPDGLRIVGLSARGGAPSDTPEVVLAHGPAGGWSIDLDVHLAGLPPDELEAGVEMFAFADLGDGHRLEGKLLQLAPSNAAGTGVARDLRLFLYVADDADWQRTACDLADTLAPVELAVSLIQPEEAVTTTAPTEGTVPVRLLRDPFDAPYCYD